MSEPLDMDGLWAMIFSGEDGPMGAGVVRILGAAASGGDSGHYWVGVVGQGKDGGIEGTFNVRRFLRGVPNIAGIDADRFVVKVKGGNDPARLWAAIQVEGKPEFKCSLEMRRMHD